MQWRAPRTIRRSSGCVYGLQKCRRLGRAPAISLAVHSRHFRSISRYLRFTEDNPASSRPAQAPSKAPSRRLSHLSRFDLTSPSQDAIPEIPEEPASGGYAIPFLRHAQLMASDPHKDETLKREIKVSGLIQSIRKQKKAAFAHISDGSTVKPFQAVLSPEQAADITNGSYVSLRGIWQESSGQGQSHELQVSGIETIGPADPEKYPIQKKFQTDEFLRTLPHLRLRTPFYSLVTRVRSQIIRSLLGELVDTRAIEVQPPLITSSDCEGAGEVFTISPRASILGNTTGKEPQQYFREPKYLTVSAQLHLEAYCAELGDVFALSPVFRAEESDTTRHLSEFYMLEAEYRDVSLETVMDRVEKSVRHVVKYLRSATIGDELLQYYADPKHRGDETRIKLEERWDRLESEGVKGAGWKRITHESAVQMLLSADTASNGTLFETRPSFTNSLQLEHERWIVENIADETPVFVTHYPRAAKPFYMLPSPQKISSHGVETVACFDLLFPFGYCEVAGGSLREHRLENLVSNMRERGMLKKRDATKPAKDSEYPFLQPDEDLGNLRWYADLRRFGSSPHGGYGLGFDRLLAYLTGVSNVRDVVAFPRTWGRADC